MGSPRIALVAGVCVGVTVLAEAGSVVFGWGRGGAHNDLGFGVYEVTVVVIGLLITLRHARNPVGWILLGSGATQAVFSDLASSYGGWAAVHGGPGGPLAEAVGLGSWICGALMWVLVLLFIPTGRLIGRRWWAVVVAAVAGAVIYLPGFLLDPSVGRDFAAGTNPYAVRGAPHGLLMAVGGGALCLAMVASVASLLIRRRTAGPVERLQLKWVALAGVVLVVLLPTCLAFWSVSPLVQAATPLLLSIAVLCLGAAVLRYRLFDVDVIVNRTVVYLVLSILLGAAYAATAIALGAVLGGRFSSWTAAAAALVAAAAFRPLRRAVQGVVDRRFDRDRHSAAVRIDAFLERLRSGTEQPERVEKLLRDVLGDPTLRVLLLLPASGCYSDVRGEPVEIDPDRTAVGLDRGGTPDVRVEYAASDDPAHAMRVRDAVERSRLAIEIARLRVDLNRQLAELDRSRARIAGAADAERRRIQRDLHDGAQQRLVTVGMALRATELRLRHAGRPDEAERLDTAVAELAATIEELRTMAQQLPLAQLDSGIAAAFRELAERTPLPVHVDVTVERLAPHVESTAYFVGCEGLTNVIKHAHASVITLRAARHNGALVVSVADDGIGGAAVRPGSGLDGLADRVKAMGGRLLLTSDRAGTMLTAELPCG